MDYYNKIKDVIEDKTINEGVRRLQSNKDTLKAYYEIGKLLLEAQGGEKRTKYGNELIKNWSLRLVKQYGKGYDVSNLKRMRQFDITWTHWRYILPIKDENERNYYIN